MKGLPLSGVPSIATLLCLSVSSIICIYNSGLWVYVVVRVVQNRGKTARRPASALRRHLSPSRFVSAYSMTAGVCALIVVKAYSRSAAASSPVFAFLGVLATFFVGAGVRPSSRQYASAFYCFCPHIQQRFTAAFVARFICVLYVWDALPFRHTFRMLRRAEPL